MAHNFLLHKLSVLPVVLEGSIMDFVFVNTHLIFPQRCWLTMAVTQSTARSRGRLPFAPVGACRFWTWRAKAVWSCQGEWFIIYVACRRIHYTVCHFHLLLVSSFFAVFYARHYQVLFSFAHRGCEGGRERLAALTTPWDTGLFCFCPFHLPAYFFLLHKTDCKFIWHSLLSSSNNRGLGVEKD